MPGVVHVPNSYDQLEELFRSEYKTMFRIAVSKLHNAQYAEDAVQDTFVVAYRKIDKCLGSPNPVAWLYSALRITIKEVLRDQEKTMKRWVTLENLPEISEEMELYDELKDSKNEDLMLLKRVYVDGYTAKEMAEEHGIKLSAMKMRISRAKRKLRNDLNWSSDYFEKM